MTIEPTYQRRGCVLISHSQVFSRMISYTLVLFVMTSCAKEKSQLTDPLMNTETLSNGVVRISYDVLPSRLLTLDTLSVIDPWSDDTGYLFSSIGSVLGGDESVYIVDRRNKEIAQLDLNGTLIQTFGRPGGGPGEFNTPRNLAWNEDQLWISDSGHRRISVFSVSGNLIRDFMWPRIINRSLGRFEVNPEGYVYSIFQAYDSDFMNQQLWYLCRYIEGNANADTLLTMKASPAEVVILESLSGLKQQVNTTPIYASYLWWALSDNTLLTISSLDYRIEFRNLDGELKSLLEIPMSRLPVTTDTKLKWIEEEFSSSPFAYAFTQRGDQPSRESLNQLPFAEQRQAIIGISVDPLSRIWVLSPTEDPSVNMVKIFRHTGEYLGGLDSNELPKTFLLDGSPIFSIHTEDDLERYVVCNVR